MLHHSSRTASPTHYQRAILAPTFHFDLCPHKSSRGFASTIGWAGLGLFRLSVIYAPGAKYGLEKLVHSFKLGHFTVSCREIWGRYHGGQRQSSDDSFHSHNRHSTIATRQTEYHEALPSSANDEVRCDCTFADNGDAS